MSTGLTWIPDYVCLLCIHHWPSSYAAFLHALLHWNSLVSFTNDFHLDKPNGQLSDPIIFPSCLGMPDIAKHLLSEILFMFVFWCLIHFFSQFQGYSFLVFVVTSSSLFLCQALNIQGMSLIKSSILVPVILSFIFSVNLILFHR